MNSQTEENYLKAIYKLTSDGNLVSIQDLADELKIALPSANEMIRRFNKNGLTIHQKYVGIKLSENGLINALSIVRKHRLWKVFLSEKLGFGWDEVHDVAEQLEHIKSDKLVSKLDSFLGFPRFDPHGDPIPDKNGKIIQSKPIALNTLSKGAKAQIIRINNHTKSFLRYCEENNLLPGKTIKVKEILSFDNSFELSIHRNLKIFLSNTMASKIDVTLKIK